LAQCLGDAGCAKNLVCLNACSLKAKNGDEETACQIKCGDRYGDAAVEAFNACAVSQEKCVPQRADEGLFPVPPDCALDRTFDLSRFTGRWYITAGLNDLFDTFDCQVHYFATPGPTSLVAKINWRIAIPGGDFLERSTVQTFVQPQPADNPAVLLNHNNETLHYEDDWYVLASKPDEYVFVYYRGNNDAWSGYGGAVVYTKEAKLPEKYVPELEKAAEAAGLKWSDFKLTDNTCGPHPPRAPSLGAQVAREVGVLEGELEGELEGALRSFGRGFTRIERKLGRELTETEKQLEKELQEAERLVLEVERSFVEEEKELAQDLGSVVRRLFGGGR
jgi:violaxanthin de-epoxidase